MGLFDRHIVGWLMTVSLTRPIVLDELVIAVRHRKSVRLGPL